MKLTSKTAIILCALCLSAPLREASAAQYSKLAIVTTAKQAGKWELVKSWINEAGLTDEWQAAAYFSDDYPLFADITNRVVTSGVATKAEIDAFLAAARDLSPDALVRNAYAEDMKTEGGRAKWHGGKPSYTYSTNETERAIYRIETYPDGYTFSEETSRKYLTPEEQAERAKNKLRAAERKAKLYEELLNRRAKLAAQCAAYEAAPAASNRTVYAKWVIALQQTERSIAIYERSVTNQTTVVVTPEGR